MSRWVSKIACFLGKHNSRRRTQLSASAYVFRCPHCRKAFYVNELGETFVPLTEVLRKAIERGRGVDLRDL